MVKVMEGSKVNRHMKIPINNPFRSFFWLYTLFVATSKALIRQEAGKTTMARLLLRRLHFFTLPLHCRRFESI